MTWLDGVHGRYVQGRRVGVLVSHIAPLLPAGGLVLDVGAGDGHIARALMTEHPGLQVIGIDPLVRQDAEIPVRPFDGLTIPYADESFDAVLLVDVLHHAADPLALLREATRVTRQVVVIKDHYRDGFLAGPTLRFMDAVGNARHGVALPGHYMSSAEWQQAFRVARLRAEVEIRALHLYPFPASLLFERRLHFIARLRREGPLVE